MIPEEFEFPTSEEWKQIYDRSPLGSVFSVLSNPGSLERIHHSLEDFAKAQEVEDWLYQIHHRMTDVATSYVLTMFYYGKGIPDKRWYISPGKDGASIQYYPDFADVHFRLKAWFDFYSDVLYYKLFSAWDLLGHVLNARYELGVDKVYFGTAVRELQSKDKAMYVFLKITQDSPAYKRASRIRNDITHNYLPYTSGMSLCKSKAGSRTTIGLREYIPSDEVVANIHEVIDLFATTLQHILA